MRPKRTSTRNLLSAFPGAVLFLVAGGFFLGAAGAAPPELVPPPPVDGVVDGSAPELGAADPVTAVGAAGDVAVAVAGVVLAVEDEPGSGANGLRVLPRRCAGEPLTSATAPLA